MPIAGPVCRIVPWLGSHGLRNRQWELNLHEGSGTLFHKPTGRTVPAKCDWDLELPILPDMFFNTTNADDDLYDERGPAGDGYMTLKENFHDDSTAYSFLTNLQKHRRCCHWHLHNAQCSCPECALGKGQRKSHAKVRDERFVTPQPLKTLAIDFAVGIKPVSIRHRTCALISICDSMKFASAHPLKHKGDVT